MDQVRGPGETDGESRSLTKDARYGQLAFHGLGEGSGQGQPDPGALDRGPFGTEALERDEDALGSSGARPGPVSVTTMLTWLVPASAQEIVMLPSRW